jgi:hypothetical protein
MTIPESLVGSYRDSLLNICMVQEFALHQFQDIKTQVTLSSVASPMI